VGAAKAISDGNLAIASIGLNQRDELGELANTFDLMKDNLRQLVAQINNSAKEVIDISRDVSESTHHTEKFSKHVTDVMIELSESAEQQVKNVESSLQVVNDITSRIGHIDQTSQQALDVAGQMLEKALQGDQEIGKIRDQMKTFQAMIAMLKEMMQTLQAKSIEIDEMNKAISDIANQTNLLSLNAAIEAARAGEQGRGFTVVTAEIRKLSGQTNDFAQRVTKLVNSIQTHTEQAVESVYKMVSEVSDGMNLADSVSEHFEEIKILVNDTTNQIRNVSESLGYLTSYSGQIVHSVEQISSLTKTIASGTQDVTSVMEEQLAILEQNVALAHRLTSMAKNLQKTVHQFKTE